MNIYVGNLPHDATEADLRQVFGAFGEVTSVRVIQNKLSRGPRGFAFVEMAEEAEAQVAVDILNGTELKAWTRRFGRSCQPSDQNPG